jgi:hypothetical protein
MKRTAVLAAGLAVFLGLTGCEEPASEMPKPDEVPMSRAPVTPNPGNYTGLETRRDPRPPRSGLNADPSNPSGAPGVL